MAKTRNAMSVKQQILRMIRRLPDDCTLDDIQYHLHVRAKVERALATLDDGKGLSQEEVERRTAEWLESFGKTRH